MEREKKEKSVVIAALIVAILSLSVAFAAVLTKNLEITGTTNISSAKWDVYFASAETAEDSDITATKGPTVNGKTSVTYTIDLAEGKTYDLNTVIKNDGTYGAKLNKLTLTGHEAYDGLITYTTSGLAQGATIEPNGGEEELNIHVSMGTITNDNIGLLENGDTLALTVVAEFVQAD